MTKKNGVTKDESVVSYVERFCFARRVGVPLAGITTANPASVIHAIADALEAKLDGSETTPPIYTWDAARGIVAVNKLADSKLGSWVQGEASNYLDPAAALRAASNLPENGVLFYLNAHRWIDQADVAQAAWNLREPFKRNFRSLVFLAPSLSLPIELQQDVIVFESSLPTDEQLRTLAGQLVESAKLDVDKKKVEAAVVSMRGLSDFAAEQIFSMALSRDRGLDLASVRESRRVMIEQVAGLKVDRDRPNHEDIRGLSEIRYQLDLLFAGPERPALIVRMDELEKATAGAGDGSATAGDSSGVQQDAQGQFLTAMEQYGWYGFIAGGPAGTGKTFISEVIGGKYDVESLSFDWGAMRGKYVGESEGKVRAGIQTIYAIGGRRVLFVGTCNRFDSFSPALVRRFDLGMYFFDLPSDEERAAILDLNIAKYGLDPKQERPVMIGWSSANVRNLARNAYRKGISLIESAKSVIPVSVSDPKGLDSLRRAAAGQLLSASYPGSYRMPDEALVEQEKGERALRVGATARPTRRG